MTPDEAWRETYNALVAAGWSHEDTLYHLRQIKAAAGSGPVAEIAGEAGATLPPPSPAHPSVVTPEERGRRGYLATEAKYGKAQMNRWRRTGGRKPNRTLAEIMAAIVPERARVQSGRKVR